MAAFLCSFIDSKKRRRKSRRVHRRVRLCDLSRKVDKKKGRTLKPPTFWKAVNGKRVHQETMPIVMYLGKNIKEYREKSKEIIDEALSNREVLCEFCLKEMLYHSNYNRNIKETGEKLTIIMVGCRRCDNWHSLQPDFLLPYKHYSGNEIENVIIESISEPIISIETMASLSTVIRWIEQIGERIVGTIGKLKMLFKQMGAVISEIVISPGHCYSELEQTLELAPTNLKYSGNNLGLANIWLRKTEMPMFI